MKAIFARIKRSPKMTAFIAVTLGAVLVPTALLAWGPDRPTYTMENPADHVTFDSITDNPAIGDERDFVGIREAGTTNDYTDNMTVQPGKTYTVRMYVHNNAASNLNLVAQDVTAKFNLPTNTAKSLEVDGYIDSSNASPTEVYDDAKFTSDQNFNLSYVSGSLTYTNNYWTNGTPLPESIFTSAGAKLGYNALDGKIPGCNEYSGYVTFNVTPQFATNFNVTKQVRKDGDKNWSNSVTVNNGDTVDYEMDYTNVSGEEQDNVTFQDTMPKGIDYIPGSAELLNDSSDNPQAIPDDITTNTGVNVGNYADSGAAYVMIKGKVNDPSLTCGTKTYVNKVRVTINGSEYKEATADVVVNKACQPGQTPAPTPSLPETGISNGLLTVFGTGGLTAAAAYVVRSNRIRNLLRR